jgi:hypothetical protein
MKIAVCYSGSIRIFTDVIDTHVEYLLSKFDCDVFLETWDIYGYGGHKLKYETTQDDIISEGDKEKILTKIKPLDYNFEDYYLMEKFFKEKEKEYYEGYPYVRNILSMFYKIKKCNDMVLKQNKVYDLVLRLRCDHQFIDDVQFETISENTLYTNELGSWGQQTVVDQFFYGNQDVMNKVTKTYDKLDCFFKNGLIGNAPEYLFYHSLIEDNIFINKKPINYYKLKRAKGQEYH